MKILILITISIGLFISQTHAEKFTFGTIPDTQNLSETDIGEEKMKRMTQFYVDKWQELNMVMVASLGDMTQWGSHDQYQRVKRAYDNFQKNVNPFAPCQGNHDPDLNTFRQYFPVSDFQSNNPYFKGYFRGMENAYYTFTRDNYDFMVLVLQSHDDYIEHYDLESIEWANQTIQAHPNHNVIVVTHDFFQNRSLLGDLITKHDNIFMAVCGHSCSREAYWTEKSPSGKTVHCIMTDYQCDSDGGATNAYYTIDTQTQSIEAFTYNTTSQSYENDANSNYTFQVDWVSKTQQTSEKPYNDTPTQIPGVINAEEYNLGGQGIAYHDVDSQNFGNQFRQDAVDIEPCAEGGYNIGWIRKGEWLDYRVNVNSSSLYKIKFRVARLPAGSSEFQLLNSSGNAITEHLLAPSTGGWQAYTNIETQANLIEGQYDIRLIAHGDDFNLQQIAFEIVHELQTHPPIARAGENRDAVYFEHENGVWIDLDGSASSDLDGTIEKYTWTINGEVISTKSMDKIFFTEGSYVLTLEVIDNDGLSSQDHVQLNIMVNKQTQEPFWGTPTKIPGLIQAENYDLGGEGIAYHDKDEINHGHVYRNEERVDLQNSTDEDLGINVGWVRDGEWLEYTLEVQQDVNYEFSFRVARAVSGEGTMKVWSNEKLLIDNISIPETGDWQNWTDVQVNKVPLQSGVHVFKLEFVSGPFNLNHFSISPSVQTNTPPVAIAGSNIKIVDQNKDGFEVIHLDGSSSYDTDGDLLNYVWIVNGKTYREKSIYLDLPVGQYQARLEVEDSKGAKSTSELQIDILATNLLSELFNSPLPSKISELTYYTDIDNKIFHEGVHPYDVNSPLWSDGTIKERYIAFTQGGKAHLNEIGNRYLFPEGTILIKEFYLEMTKGLPESKVLLETRFMVFHNESWNRFTYIWNETQTDADLSTQSVTKNLNIKQHPDLSEVIVQPYTFPSQNDCKKCHLDNQQSVLGFTPNQLTGQASFRDLITLGLVDEPNNEMDFSFAPWADQQSPLEHRVRSYLHSNCAHCHSQEGRDSGATFKLFNFNYDHTNQEMDYLNLNTTSTLSDVSRVVFSGYANNSTLHQRIKTRDPQLQMPPLGTHIIDEQALSHIHDWIQNLTPLDQDIGSSSNSIISNGDFSNGSLNWNLYINGLANAQNLQTQNGFGVEITQPGTMDWHIQLLQGGLVIEENRTYTVRFKARSEGLQQMIAKVVLNEGDYRDLSQEHLCQLNLDWTIYEFTFTMAESTQANSKMQFSIGNQEIGKVWIDDVECIPHEKDHNNTPNPWPATVELTTYIEPHENITRPVAMQSLPNDEGYLVLGQHSGELYHLLQTSGSWQKNLIYSIAPVRRGNEQGLLGITLHPEFENNRKFYISFQKDSGPKSLSVVELTLAPSLSTAFYDQLIIDIPIPSSNDNHNGGALAFGPDGYLYIAIGDGGRFREIQTNSMAGTILRIEVHPDSEHLAYTIPQDNPDLSPRPREVWAVGFRNPWTMSFSKIHDKLLVADVGQSRWEEVNIVHRGHDYGWPKFEGNNFHDSSSFNRDNSTLPIYQYPTQGGGAIIGGYVVTKQTSPFYGAYIFADMGKGTLSAMLLEDQNVIKVQKIANFPVWSIYNFFQDHDGEIYMIYGNGTVMKLEL